MLARGWERFGLLTIPSSSIPFTMIDLSSTICMPRSPFG